MADEGLISTKKPHFNDQHKMLRAYIHELFCEKSATVAITPLEAQPSVVMMPAPEFHTPEDISRLVVESQAETQPQALFRYSHTGACGS